MTIGISELEFDEEDDEEDLERLKLAEEAQRKRVRVQCVCCSTFRSVIAAVPSVTLSGVYALNRYGQHTSACSFSI
jgi:hypothetical protein